MKIRHIPAFLALAENLHFRRAAEVIHLSEPALLSPVGWYNKTRSGQLTVIKENSAMSFSVEQTPQTMPDARTLALDTKTNQLLLIAAEYEPRPVPPDMTVPP